MENRQKILLTGATGFVGAIIQKHFENQGFHVHTLGRNNQAMIKSHLDDGKLIAFTESYDIIVHMAGKAHSVPRNNKECQDFFDVNFEGTKKLANSLVSSHNLPRSFIFISTVAVYGLDKGEFVNEDMPLDGSTPYAKSKILAEKYLIEWADKYGIKLGILRLPLVAGPNAPGNLGAMISGIKSGKYLSIGKADSRKSMVWAEDIAHIIPKLAEVGGTYNLTDGYHPTFKELEGVISRAFGKKVPLTIPMWLAKLVANFGDIVRKFPINSDKLNKITSTLTFDDSRARKLLAWNPSPVLEKLRDKL